MTTLTDRYVFAVLRRIPEAQRADLERELRSSVADLIDARRDAGDSAAQAETAALLELGDPDRFADRVTDRPQYLIGPATYSSWLRLLKFLILLLAPVAAVVHTIVLVALGSAIEDVIAGFIATLIQVALQVAFWVTLVFVILERTSGERRPKLLSAWTPDRLPDFTRDRRTVGDLASELVWIGVIGAVILGQQFWSFAVIQGETVPVLAPAEWSFWWPYFLVLLVLEAVFAVWVWRRGTWSWSAAVVNLLLGLAWAVPLVWLALSDRVWNPEFFAALGWTSPEVAEIGVNSLAMAIVVLVAVGVDVAQGAIKAKRAQPDPRASVRA